VAKVTVRLTLFQEPVDIDEDEVPGLRAQGLLIEDEPSAAPSPAEGPRSGRADKTPEETP
jgi:hypothetical protein